MYENFVSYTTKKVTLFKGTFFVARCQIGGGA